MTSQYIYTYTPQQLQVWRDWYRDTLLRGRRWFAHALPGQGGLVSRVVRYIEVQEQLLGVGIYRVSARFEQRGASLPPETDVGDQHWGNVLFLLNGQDIVTKDAGPLNLTLGNTGAMALDATRPLFGFPTYRSAGVNSSSRLQMTSDGVFADAIGNDEWCWDGWVRADTGNNGLALRFFYFGQWIGSRSSAGAYEFTSVIGGTSRTIAAQAISCPDESWLYFKFCRDKADPVFDYTRVYVNNILADTSSGFSKSNAVATGDTFGWLMGYNGAIGGNFSNFRFTKGTSRIGESLPTAPFPTRGV